jgi:hypothetical protein
MLLGEDVEHEGGPEQVLDRTVVDRADQRYAVGTGRGPGSSRLSER